MERFLLFALSLASFVVHSLAACDCYQIDSGEIFTNYRFIDFRLGMPGNYDDFFTALDIPNYGGQGDEITNDMTPANVVPGPNYLQLITKNTGGTQTSANIEGKTPLLFGSFRSRFQVTGATGGVAGFFTYKDANNEQDIEILTNEPKDQIHYTTHGTPTNPTLNTTIPFTWTDFTTHRFDWIPGAASFEANNVSTGNINQEVPTLPCVLSLNMWSSGPEWGGVMPQGQSAQMNVQWIEAIYNTTTPSSSQKIKGRTAPAATCSAVCKVDGVPEIGVPVPI